jgi:hypothetical protein
MKWGSLSVIEGANFDHARIEQKMALTNLVSYVDKEAEGGLVAVSLKNSPEAGFITVRRNRFPICKIMNTTG